MYAYEKEWLLIYLKIQYTIIIFILSHFYAISALFLFYSPSYLMSSYSQELTHYRQLYATQQHLDCGSEKK